MAMGEGDGLYRLSPSFVFAVKSVIDVLQWDSSYPGASDAERDEISAIVDEGIYRLGRKVTVGVQVVTTGLNQVFNGPGTTRKNWDIMTGDGLLALDTGTGVMGTNFTFLEGGIYGLQVNLNAWGESFPDFEIATRFVINGEQVGLYKRYKRESGLYLTMQNEVWVNVAGGGFYIDVYLSNYQANITAARTSLRVVKVA